MGVVLKLRSFEGGLKLLHGSEPNTSSKLVKTRFECLVAAAAAASTP